MNTDDNIVEFTGEWHGVDTPVEMTEEEYTSAMEELLASVNEDQLTRILAGVLEFLTARAVMDGSYYIMTDDKDAMAVFAAKDDTKILFNLLPPHFKSWEDDMEIPPFDTDRDPGDEQDEPTPVA